MSYQGDFMGLQDVSAFGTKLTLKNIIERWDYEIHIMDSKRIGLDNQKKIKWNNITGNIATCVALCVLFSAFLHEAIYPRNAFLQVSCLCLSFISGSAAIHRFIKSLACILEYNIFIERKCFLRYITSQNLLTYYRAYDYYTQVIIDLEKRSRVYRNMLKKLNNNEQLSEQEIDRIENIKDTDYHYTLKTFHEHKIYLSDIFTYLGK